jgi:hypothetical protein
VALAEDVHRAARAEAARAAAADGAERLERQRLGAGLLAGARSAAGPDGDALRAEVAALASDLRRHARLLRALGLAPADLALPTDARTAAKWARRRLHLLVLGALALLGTAVGWVPYRVTGRVAALIPGADATDVRATSKALVGGVCFLAWTLLLAAVAWALGGPWAAAGALVGLPPLLLLTLATNEGWQDAWRDARRFLALRRRAARVAELRARQADLADRIGALVERLRAERENVERRERQQAGATS